MVKSLFKLGQFEEIQKNASTLHFKPTQTVFYAGNQATGLYFIKSGTVKLEALDEDGKTQTIQIINNGGILGYRALFGDDTYSATAISVTDAEVLFIPKQLVKELMQHHPEVALQFLEQISGDIKQLQTRLQHATTHSAQERIAESLLFLRENHPEKTWSRKEIAEWAGTTPETVMRTLSEFSDLGWVELKGRQIIIQNRGALLKKAKISVG